MFSFTTLLIVSTVTFIAGCLLTLLMTRTLSSSEQKTRSLETRLQQAEENLASYQQEVTEHFSETAELVNNLTQSYKDVHEHLTGSALKLANVDISRQLLSNNPSSDEEKLAIAEEDFEPPKDWAPSEGTLSEGYGLTEDSEHTASAIPPQSK